MNSTKGVLNSVHGKVVTHSGEVGWPQTVHVSPVLHAVGSSDSWKAGTATPTILYQEVAVIARRLELLLLLFYSSTW